MNKNESRTLRIILPVNRDYTGTIALLDEEGGALAGPFPICGRASDQIAADHGNPSRATTLPYGDAPLGMYRVAGLVPTGPETSYRRDLFGVHGALVLHAKSGEAALAEANGRFEILIHGGPLSADGRIRATTGHMRISDADLLTLSQAIGKSGGVLCECVQGSRVPGASPVDGDFFSDVPAKQATDLWVVRGVRNVHAPTLIAHGEYSPDPDPDPDPDPAAAADALGNLANQALANNPDNCSGSVAEVASGMGNQELSGLDANGQVSYMEQNWTQVSAEDAQKMANKGELVVAGLAVPGEHGHTAVVVPGSGATKPDGKFYPNVEGGASNPAGKSDGTKTAGDVWNTKVRGNVGYYAPKKK